MENLQGMSLCKPETTSSFVGDGLVNLVSLREIEITNTPTILAPDKKQAKNKAKKNFSNLIVADEVLCSPELFTPPVFRLFIKNGQYVYARAADIIMIESCDHLVKVYLGISNKAKLTLRHNTLKDFLLQLPPSQFMRIGRFCAVNVTRLSGGNCNDQTFEFDFKISLKLAHSVSHKVFSAIGK